MYLRKEINKLLAEEGLEKVSRQILSRMRGIKYKVKRYGGKEYQSEAILAEDIHYVPKTRGNKIWYYYTDEGVKIIRQWAIERRIKQQQKKKSDDVRLKEYLRQKGVIDFNVESLRKKRFSSMSKTKFNEIIIDHNKSIEKLSKNNN